LKTETTTIDTIAEEFNDQGFAVVQDLFTPAAVDELRGRLSAIMSSWDEIPANLRRSVARPDGAYSSKEAICVTMLHQELMRCEVFVRAQELADDLLDTKCQMRFDHIIVKPAQIGSGTPWHQDRAYWTKEESLRAVHYWIPMDDATVEGGCMQFVHRSKIDGFLEHKILESDPARHLRTPDGDFDSIATPAPVRSGGCTIHNPMTMHKTGANISQATRTAWVLQFADARTPREFARRVKQHLRVRV
jgi:ectoine hydroxylase-related dioxygenase (phytanoyl-CoA dioxygenase family)